MAFESTSQVTALFGGALIVYVAVMFGVSWWARGRIDSTEDYIVAGRRLPLFLAWPTLFATWFGAGTLLTASDEVRAEGLTAAALDPIGAGLCLFIAGLFFAGPLWRMELLTLGDFFRKRFGPRAEILASLLMVPGYAGWIAAQFVALAGVLHLFFGIDLNVGILLVAAVGIGYTLIGGMWSVTLTDFAQMILLLLGLLVLTVVTVSRLGDGSLIEGFRQFADRTPPSMLSLVPTEDLRSLVQWTAVLAAGALGNLPGQDLMQRVFASKSESVAKRACHVAGGMYLVVGALPLVIALSGNLIAPDATGAIVPYLAHELLSPALAVIFLLALASAVLSTIDSAILSPASVLSQNLLGKVRQKRFDSMSLNYISVLIVGVASIGVAYLGESAYGMLEAAYEIGLVSLLVPLAFGLFGRSGNERAALTSMIVGTVLWLLHLLLGWELFLPVAFEPLGIPLPVGLSCAASAAVAYLATRRGVVE